MTIQKRTEELLRILPEIYPDAHCELDFNNPLELLVATILSAQCTDKRVNMVTPKLFERCPSAKDYAEMSQAELEELIRTTGFFRSKATSIRLAMQAIVENHNGEIPASMEELTALPGVGRKTANVVLGNAFGINCGVVVDTHVLRLSTRLGLTHQKNPEKVEKDLIGLIPSDRWTLFSHWLIFHGRRRCFAKRPNCPNCELLHLCPTGPELIKQKLAKLSPSSNLPATVTVKKLKKLNK